MSNGERSRRESALLLVSLGDIGEVEAESQRRLLTEQAYALACVLPDGWQVLVGFRFGVPTIQQALAKLHGGVEELVVVPMYPQFADAASGEILREVYRVVGELRRPVDLATRSAWYNDGGYVNAQARLLASFTASMELYPEDAHLLLVAQGFSGKDAEESSAYTGQVEHTAQLVFERLGWPDDRASVAFRSPRGTVTPVQGDVAAQLAKLMRAGEMQVVLAPMSVSADSNIADGRLAEDFPDQYEYDDLELVVAPALDTYGPFITAMKNLAVRGPRAVQLGSVGTAPLLVPRLSPEDARGSSRSLVMIGASIPGKVRARHGPEVVHSVGTVFCAVKKTRKELRAFLDWVREETPVEEAFVWSTCQRIEFYGWHSESGELAYHEWPVAEIRQHLYGAEPEGLKVNVLFGAEAWHHLMRTACGMNSALPGDTDVVAQLQTACRMAERVGTAGGRTTRLVDSAVALAQEVRANTPWSRFSRGFCSAALSRVHDLVGADLERCRHVVIGGSATSRSVLGTLLERFQVPQSQMTLVYRDHHGQMRLLRSAIGHGKRLRVHSYSERGVIAAIGSADFVFFGIDHAEPVISAEMLSGERDFEARPLVVIDFNDSGSVTDLDSIKGISVWTADDLERAVESYADVMCADAEFSRAQEKAESWIEAHLPGAEND